MQGSTIDLVMQERLSKLRADSPASRRERAALELRRIEKEVRPWSSSQLGLVSEPPSEPRLGWLRLIASPLDR